MNRTLLHGCFWIPARHNNDGSVLDDLASWYPVIDLCIQICGYGPHSYYPEICSTLDNESRPMHHICLFLSFSFLTATLSAHDGPPVPEPKNLEDFMGAFRPRGWKLEQTQIVSRKIGDKLYVFNGAGGNMAVSIGDDGVLVVDYQFPVLMPKIKAEIARLGGNGIDFAINTHWHFDHAEGNLALGPADTWLVAQANSREMMKQDHIINLVTSSYEQKAYPESAWPDITFDNAMHFHFNGEQVDLMHFGAAHTTGDTAVIFRGHNAVHLGDVYNNAGYPFIDAGNGGHFGGLIKFCTKTLKQIDAKTIVIPGHGAVSDYQGLADYIEMLQTIRKRMMVLIRDGATLAEVYDAEVTEEWDEKKGNPKGFINRAYMSLTHRVVE